MVVLPEHLHALWTLPAEDADFAVRWALIAARRCLRFDFRSSIPDDRTALAPDASKAAKRPAAVAHHPAADARGIERDKGRIDSYAAAVAFYQPAAAAREISSALSPFDLAFVNLTARKLF
jgi:REP element-mobilizing transposase RayT